MSDSRHCHPLQRTGTSQIARLVQALRPDAFRLDERTTQDMLVAAYRYAQTLKYFDETNKHKKDAYWDSFWEVETLTYLAVVAATDTAEIRRRYEDANEMFIQALHAQPSPGGKKPKISSLASYRPLLEQLRLLALSLEEAYQKLVRINHPLQTLLLNRIRRDNCCDEEELEGALVRLVGLHKCADAGLKIDKYAGFFASDKRWGMEGRVDYDAISANPHFSQNDLGELFTTFFNTWTILKNAAQAGFDAELARMELPQDVEPRIVQPHIALFLVFLRLFRYAQESMNELGARHLNFYYEEVLGLRRRGEVPDEVYLLFELAKDVNQHLLEKGTEFLAGKDKNGQPLLFETIEDWVLHPAKVGDIKNTWIDLVCGDILANPDVKKAYLGGKEKPNESAESWRSMGDDMQLPDGEVGFAIASPQLILREGKRVVDVTLNLINEIANPINLKPEYFRVFLSSEEQWIDLGPNTLVVPDSTQIPDLSKGSFGITFEEKAIHIRMVLERDDLPVVHFGEAFALKAGFETRWPMMKLIINPELEKPCPVDEDQNLTISAVYEMLRPLQIGEIMIKVDVRGIRENLIIQSDQGVFDGTQKVFPFGPVPEMGNRFYVGSTEVFQKALDDLFISFDWIAPPESFEKHYVDYTRVLGSQPEPFVQIDFIDRAQTPTPKQVVRFGDRNQGTTITGTVTNIVNTPLQGVTVEIKKPTGVSIVTISDVAGNYTLSSPGGFNPASTIRFIPPTQNASDPDDIALYEPLSDFAEKAGDPKQEIQIKSFSTINVVLFPKSVRFENYEEITGLITDIYEKPVSGVKVKTTLPTSSTTSGDGIFKLVQSQKPSSVEIELPTASPYKEIQNPIALNDFTELAIVLEPEQKLNEIGGAINSGNPEISGKIKDTKDDHDLKGAFVEAKNSQPLTITVFTDNSGDYTLPLPDTSSVVNFYPDTYANSIVNRPEIKPGGASGVPATNNINGKLLVPKQVEKVFIKPSANVQIKVKNYLGNPLSGINITTASSDTITFGESATLGIYNVTGVKEGSRLIFSKAGFDSLEISIGNNTDLAIMLFPVNGVDHTGTPRANPGQISGRVLDRDGVGIAGITVQQDAVPANTAITGASGEYTLPQTVAHDEELNFTSASAVFQNKSGVGSISSSIVNIILDPAISPSSTGSVSNFINGTIVDAKGQPLGGVAVIAEGHLQTQGNYIKFETKTNSSGSYALTRLGSVGNDLFLTFIKDGFVVEDVDPHPTNNTVFSHQYYRNNVVQPVLIGNIRDVNDKPVKGAKVFFGSNLLSTSTDTGSITLTPPAGANPFTLVIVHEAFQELQVKVEQNCSELVFRLLPLDVFSVLKGNITDIFHAPLAEVTAKVVGTAIERKSQNDGSYKLLIPQGSFNKIDFSYPAGFENLIVDLNTSFPTQGAAFSKSLSEIVLFYFSINFTSLLDQDKAIKSIFPININALNLVRDVRTQEFEKYSPTLKRGFIRLTLENGDFMHDEYPKVLTWYAIDAAGPKDIIAGSPPDGVLLPPIPNAPYAPATNGISLDYISTQIITGDENDRIDQYYHLLPFNGHKWLSLEAVPPATAPAIRVIYPYMPDDTDPFDITIPGPKVVMAPYAPGNLFIGLSDLQPGGTLSLLFQIAEGTEKEPEALAPAIDWSYLAAGNTWLPFGTGLIIRDDTTGLTRSGMIQFSVPTTAVKENTMLNPEYFWLRAAAKQADIGKPATKVQALPSIINIRAQVIQARFKNQGNELSHLAEPLPADTIAKLLESRTAVKKVEQPLESFGGRLPESAGLEFYFRVSERLRHKDRAITVWDYEHLLLERYRAAAAVKCIPHTRYKPASAASELAPGYVTVAVIPDLNKRKGEPWPEPRFTKGDLEDMRLFLAQHANLCVAYGENEETHLQVVNPLYEKVDVLVNVAFMSGIDEAFFKKQLQTELINYISPWLADPSKPPAFGRMLERSAILQFVESRSYVDYVDVDIDGVTNIPRFRIRMQAVDIADRPVVFEGVPKPAPGGPALLDVIVTTIKGVDITEKICLSTARSILVAGTVVVGTTKEPERLPPMPAQISTGAIPLTQPGTGTGGGFPLNPSNPQHAVYAATAKADTPVTAGKTPASKTGSVLPKTAKPPAPQVRVSPDKVEKLPKINPKSPKGASKKKL